MLCSTMSVVSQSASASRRRRPWRAFSSGRLRARWSSCVARGSGTPAGLVKGSMVRLAYSKNATVHCGPNSKK